MLAAHATENPEPIDKRRPSVPAALASLIMRSLEKHAADRPQSAAEMLAELEAAVTPSGATTPGAGVIKRPKSLGSRRTLTIASAAGVLLVVGSVASYWYVRHRAAGGIDQSSPSKSAAISTVAVLPFANTSGN